MRKQLGSVIQWIYFQSFNLFDMAYAECKHGTPIEFCCSECILESNDMEIVDQNDLESVVIRCDWCGEELEGDQDCNCEDWPEK